jgi:hypothetical protein
VAEEPDSTLVALVVQVAVGLALPGLRLEQLEPETLGAVAVAVAVLGVLVVRV